MKKQNYLGFLFIISVWLGIGTIFANNYTKIEIENQELYPSEINSISIKYKGTNSGAYYFNNRNNSAIINNYFEGFYYDKLYGIFKFNWSTNINKNVRVISGTNKCSNGYGYQLGGKAYSEYSGFIDFSGVYYCKDDGKLHGYGYNQYTGKQNFEGISLELITNAEANEILETNTGFINDNDNNVIEKDILTGKNAETSNAGDFKIGGDEFYIDDTVDSIFYIIK